MVDDGQAWDFYESRQTPNTSKSERRFRLFPPLRKRLLMVSETLLPGQPVPLLRGPAPTLGAGLYAKDGQVRASLVGVPQYKGPVGFSP